MSKKFFLVLLLLLGVTSPIFSATGIPERIGNWRVEVGPPGNDYYKPPQAQAEVKPPSDTLKQIVKTLAPHTKITRWRLLQKDIYWFRAEAGIDEYDMILSTKGEILEIEYENDSTNVEEKPDELIIKGSKQPVSEQEIPEQARKTLKKIFPEAKPSQVWTAKSLAGKRFVIVLDETVFYARPDGQIQAAGRISHGALKEIDPNTQKREKTPEELEAEIEKYLSQYKDRFNFPNQLKKLGSKPKNTDGSFRCVIMGDSRSNDDLWPSIVKHIKQLDPKPAFVINTGDVVSRGTAVQFNEYYIPPLLELDIPFFIAIGNHDDGAKGDGKEFQYLFGQDAFNYYFDYGQARFILFDNVTNNQSEDVLVWLDQTLATTPADHHKYVAAHKPPRNIEKWAYHSWDESHSQLFTGLMSNHQVEHVFFGHIHAYSTAVLNNVNYTISGGGGAGLHNRFGAMGNVHHYLICDVLPDGSMKQQVVRFYRIENTK